MQGMLNSMQMPFPRKLSHLGLGLHLETAEKGLAVGDCFIRSTQTFRPGPFTPGRKPSARTN